MKQEHMAAVERTRPFAAGACVVRTAAIAQSTGITAPFLRRHVPYGESTIAPYTVLLFVFTRSLFCDTIAPYTVESAAR